ncbi:hypothetical protein [Zhongshania aliphaticivorans]|uniref:hypothetical protein n=1 Tax=Zhongshania aliphaticivorans TaxID=1470434 RepID=UPI0012E66F82|nr:hypothetical protein [Zhongshania aliphaticivorans]CAA0097738.1 Uncharacterised protein [Zhongshania aliphaticivorans]
MILTERIFSALIARHGADTARWPFIYRLLLPVFLGSEACLLLWREAQLDENRLRGLYKDELPELEPSAALQTRLAAIARPRRQPVRESFMPVWRLSFTAAMASALLGVVLGAGGYFADYTDPDDAYTFDVSTSYEVSNWIAGTDL